MQPKAFPLEPSLPDKPARSSSVHKRKSCLTIFGEEGPSRLWQSVQLGPFLCAQGSLSGEVGRGTEECGAGLGGRVHRQLRHGQGEAGTGAGWWGLPELRFRYSGSG